MNNLSLATLDSTFEVAPGLRVERASEQQIVSVGATPIACYGACDVTSRRHVMVHLAEAGRLKGLDIAAAFEVTPVYLSLLRGQYREQGSAALTAGRLGPHGPMKVTARLEARVLALRQKGLSYRAIAAKLSGEEGICYQTVRRIVQKQSARQESLLGVEVAAVEPVPAMDHGAELEQRVSPPQGETAYAGAMLLHVALGQLGLWSVFEKLGARLNRRRLAVAQLVGIIALGFALRLKSLEGFKTALRRDFGMLLGLASIPSVQTLRSQVADLAQSVQPGLVVEKLLEAYVKLEPVWEGAYYIDGHFCPYTGDRPLPKGWNAQRRLAEPGQTDVYVHDAAGRALFFINRPLNDHLSKVVLEILPQLRSVSAGQPLVLIFDRGGYSGRLFKRLSQEGIGFITYLKGRKAKRRFSADRFQRRWWEAVDPAGIQKRKRYVYPIYEKGTRVSGAGTLRTLVVQDEEGQIPVLTNCAEMAPAKGVHLLKMRWRQENSFKYLSEHYGVEQLIQYDAEYHPDQRSVDNPQRAALKRQIQDLHMQILFQEAELGQAVEFNEEKAGKTVRALKRAHRGLRGEIDRLYQRVEALENRLAQTPTKIPVSELKGRRFQATLKTDRRNLVNAIKIATYNAERLLARRFFRHYQDPRDWLSIFRSLLRLPGSVTYEPDHIRVQLRPPDQPRVRQALEATLEELNPMKGGLFGNGPKLLFAMKS